MKAVELVCRVRPPSVNNASTKGRGAFEAAMKLEWEAVAQPMRTELLHGAVVWFVDGYRPGSDPDADNISKAVWDTLKKLRAFDDDKQVRLRTAMIVELGARSLEYLDTSRLPLRAAGAIEAILEAPRSGRRGYVTYVRLGALEPRVVEHALTLGQP